MVIEIIAPLIISVIFLKIYIRDYQIKKDTKDRYRDFKYSILFLIISIINSIFEYYKNINMLMIFGAIFICIIIVYTIVIKYKIK